MCKEIQIKCGVEVFNLATKRYGVITSMGLGCVHIVENCSNCVNGCNSDQLQIAASMLYKPGDLVASVLGGGFVGKVIGFDLLENRVICVSMKGQHSSRVRYSYGIDELEDYVKPEKTYVFQRGAVYLINDEYVVLCMADYTDEDKRILCSMDKGLPLYCIPMGPQLESTLKKLGIDKVKRLGNGGNMHLD